MNISPKSYLGKFVVVFAQFYPEFYTLFFYFLFYSRALARIGVPGN